MRVVIADDSLLIRDGLASLLRDAGVDVVARTGDVDDLVLKVRSHQPDVAVIDVRMPPTHTNEGLLAAEEIRAGHPRSASDPLAARRDRGRNASTCPIGRGLRLPAQGAGDELRRFPSALQRVAAGGSALDPQIVSQLLSRGRGSGDPIDVLTPREREVLELMAEGRSNKGIGERLVITERAVQKHVTAIFRKLGLPHSDDDHRRILAVLAYLHQ